MAPLPKARLQVTLFATMFVPLTRTVDEPTRGSVVAVPRLVKRMTNFIERRVAIDAVEGATVSSTLPSSILTELDGEGEAFAELVVGALVLAAGCWLAGGDGLHEVDGVHADTAHARRAKRCIG